jgi:purine-cytosine permease-like protein
MGDHEDYWTWARSHRLLIALVVYAGAGWVTVEVLAGVREYAGLPENLDNGFIAVYLAGFVAMITLLKTHVAGGGPPIFHALRVVSLVLMFAATGLLVAHWLDPESILATAPSVSASTSEHPVILDASGAKDGCINPAVE